jgi:hypothetical protein
MCVPGSDLYMCMYQQYVLPSRQLSHSTLLATGSLLTRRVLVTSNLGLEGCWEMAIS